MKYILLLLILTFSSEVFAECNIIVNISPHKTDYAIEIYQSNNINIDLNGQEPTSLIGKINLVVHDCENTKIIIPVVKEEKR